MPDGKIEVSVGALKFAGEGDTKWLTEQLDKILSKAEQLVKITPPPAAAPTVGAPAFQGSSSLASGGGNQGADIAGKSLATFLKEKGANQNQTKKFLATSVWVLAKEGKSRLITSDVATALKNASQTKINNPSDTLNKNVSKGELYTSLTQPAGAPILRG